MVVAVVVIVTVKGGGGLMTIDGEVMVSVVVVTQVVGDQQGE